MAKLTEAEACAELARRMGYQVIRKGPQAWHYVKPNGVEALHDFITEEIAWMNAFSLPFASRAAAAELVAWIRTQPQDLRFTGALLGILHPADVQPDTLCWAFLLATPDQITRAACAALGLEVEE